MSSFRRLKQKNPFLRRLDVPELEKKHRAHLVHNFPAFLRISGQGLFQHAFEILSGVVLEVRHN